jgi:hypothetical protein
MKIKVSNVNTPNWKDVNVKSHIPAELEKLSELARNIWWSWNFEATELFRDLEPALWKEVGQNPVLLLERMSYAKLEALAEDKVILRRMEDVYSKFRNYMDVKPDSNRPSVAYFSMEYGLNHVLKIYSGGLGHEFIICRFSRLHQENLNKRTCFLAEVQTRLYHLGIVEYHQGSLREICGKMMENIIAYLAVLIDQQFAVVALGDREFCDAIIR